MPCSLTANQPQKYLHINCRLKITRVDPVIPKQGTLEKKFQDHEQQGFGISEELSDWQGNDEDDVLSALVLLAGTTASS